ncbi:MAG: prolipoprotein diacylglyceryl transferase, partial [Candidatus Cloacimonetes bacterium]|nr:prolipoprotein diacylglyceryl transferase [Candidatus Cloacimonadota bacterium]
SQLYEAFMEGLLLFLITWLILKKVKTHGIVFWSWIGTYGIFRFLVEFVREPDRQLGFIFFSFTMGQLLSSLMILSAIVGILIIYAKQNKIST